MLKITKKFSITWWKSRKNSLDMRLIIYLALAVLSTLCPFSHYETSISIISHNIDKRGFPGGAVVENLPANAGDTGSSPGLGRSHMPRSN